MLKTPTAIRRAWLPLALTATLALTACTRNAEPTDPPAASAPAASTSSSASLVWADASLQPVLARLADDFQRQTQRRVQIHHGDSAPLRQALQGTAGSAVQLYIGLAVPPGDNDVLVVHPGDVQQRQLGLGSDARSREGWGATQWIWRDRVCTLSRVPATPATAMGQWQRKGLVLAGDFAEDGRTPAEPLARILVHAEGLQPGLRETLLGKLGQWRAQSPVKQAVPALRQSHAHMAIAPCAQMRAQTRAQDGQGAAAPEPQIVPMPPALDVALDYGMALRTGASDTARQFAQYLRSDAAAAVAKQVGLTAVPAKNN